MKEFIKSIKQIDDEMLKSVISKIKANKKLNEADLLYLNFYLELKKRREKMLESKFNYYLENKGINNVISKKDGKEYNLKTLYLKEPSGLICQIVVNDYLYNKAEVGKSYKLKAVISTNGKFQINDLELIK